MRLLASLTSSSFPIVDTSRCLSDLATQAILELHWSPNSPTIVTASADKTLGYWDANAGKRKKTFKVRERILALGIVNYFRGIVTYATTTCAILGSHDTDVETPHPGENPQ